ncbi:hypothetical protein [Streptomyces abikoensis]|uniref:hypothetical protein n=1 Tax=Streptomyces abikoensis TaxID=97398 RepID=UPI001676D684|nr:hypothetical protein [Streptomyces abikoensis]GGP54731.1 hypothetical protein GCM10010214_29780 [Streptomyces abikoensis]
MRLFSRALTTGAIAATMALTGTVSAAAAEIPPTGVEDFDYPQADKIYQERGIKLLRGDGHITLVECDSRPDLITIHAWGLKEKKGGGKFCFRLTGKEGRLTLDLPRTYGANAKGSSFSVRLNMITGSEEKHWDLSKENWTPVGDTADDQQRDFTLLEIVAKK